MSPCLCGYQLDYGELAQLGEHLPCKQGVTSSNLVFSSYRLKESGCTLKTEYKKTKKSQSRKAKILKDKRFAVSLLQTFQRKAIKQDWSSKKEHKENALALGADERRGKLRKASGRRKQPSIRRYLNGETCLSKPQVSVRESIACGGERCELKHLSSSRRRKKTRFPE